MTDTKHIEEIFARGTVEQIIPSKEELLVALNSGKKLKIYIGFDPTAPALHIGHAKNLIFLEEMRQLGHEVIVLFGDFTAQIGDPDKNATRKQLTSDEIKNNLAGWMRDIGRIVDFETGDNPAVVKYNSEWLSKLSFGDVVSLASNFTVQQMLERDMFDKRFKDGVPIHLHEFLYPLMQGYDSVAMDVDVELCGTDQIFNAMAGRTLMKRLKDKDKFVIALNLLSNPATGELMSKSNGTGIFINLPPNELFGAIMSLPDSMIEPLFLNCTRIPLVDKSILIAQGPREAKARIASDIVKRLHGEELARHAEDAFDETFANKGVPDDAPEIILGKNDSLVEVLVSAGIVSSKTDWRRLVTDGAVRTADDDKISDPNFLVTKNIILKIGKRRFVKIVKKL